MLPECRPITTFEEEHVHVGTGGSLTSEGGVRLGEGYGDVDERAVIDSSDEDETSSAEESVGSNSPVSEEEGRRGGPLHAEMVPGPAVPATPPERRKRWRKVQI